MRISKFIMSLSVITMAALVYVHQQVELVKLSYAIEHKEKRLKDMLDRKESLGYNIDNLEAPSRLEKVLLSQRIDITLPKRGQVIKVAKAGSNVKREERLKTAGPQKVDIFRFFEFLSPRAEAQGLKEK